MMSGAAIVFFCLHRIRCGFDYCGGDKKIPQRDMPIGIIASLYHFLQCSTFLMAGSYYGDENIHNLSRRFGGSSDCVRRQALGAGTYQCRGAGWPYFGAAGFSIRPAAHFHGHGARRVASPVFCEIHRRFRTPYITTIWTGIAVGVVAMLTDIGSLADLTNIGTLFAFMLVCLGVIVLRRKDADRPSPI